MRFLVAVVCLALAACGGPSPDATGAEVFAQTCARCHGASLEGGVGPALGPGSNAAQMSEEYLIRTITDGKGRMPSFRQTLSDEQIERVVDYLRRAQAGT